MPRPTGSMPPVVSLSIDGHHPGLMSTASQAGYELSQAAKSRVTSTGKHRSCRSAIWRGALVARSRNVVNIELKFSRLPRDPIGVGRSQKSWGVRAPTVYAAVCVHPCPGQGWSIDGHLGV
jgi:hypothetical protein